MISKFNDLLFFQDKIQFDIIGYVISIGEEISSASSTRKQVTLMDKNSTSIVFTLWGNDVNLIGIRNKYQLVTISDVKISKYKEEFTFLKLSRSSIISTRDEFIDIKNISQQIKCLSNNDIIISCSSISEITDDTDNKRFNIRATINKIEDCNYKYCNSKSCNKKKIDDDNMCSNCNDNDYKIKEMLLLTIKDLSGLKLQLSCFDDVSSKIVKNHNIRQLINIDILKNVSVNGNINYNCFSVELSPIVGHIHDNLQLDCHEKADNKKLTNSSSVKPEILNSKAEYYECDNLPANYQKSKKLITTPRTTNKEHYEVDDSNVVHNNYKKLTVPIKSKRIQPFESDDDELHDNIQLKTVVPPKNIKPSKSNNKQRYVDSEIIPGNYIEKTISTNAKSQNHRPVSSDDEINYIRTSYDNSPANYQKSKKLITTPSATNKKHYEVDDSNDVHNNYKNLTVPIKNKQIQPFESDDDELHDNIQLKTVVPPKNIKTSKSNNKQRYVDSEIIPGNYIEKTISTSSGDNSPAHYEKSKKLIATPSATNKEHYEEDDSDVVHNNYKTLTKLPNERKQIIVSDFEDDQPLVNLKPNIIKPSKLSAPKTPIQRKLRSSKIDLDESNMSMKRSPTLSFEQQNNKKKSNK